MDLFTNVTAKVFAGIAGIFAIIVIVLTLQGWGKDREIADLKRAVETGRTELAQCEAARAQQNAAIARQGEEAERQRQAFADALAAGNQLVRDAQGRVTVVRQSPRNGCVTPPVIRGADL